MGIAIRIENLSKRYSIGAKKDRHDTLREHLMHGLRAAFAPGAARRPRHETIWALKDVSLEIKAGEILGIIGTNGAGKSTLLKILSRITEPTSGRAEIHGQVGSLLEVGTGFDRELTGRENIYLNGAILGMSKAEIRQKYDEIVEFSGVEKFLETPVKRYSSGMYVRLAFAVAAHLAPEILIVDEVLAVGDAAFQKKCLGKMGTVAKEGRTILFVSHNMAAIQALCTRGVLMKDGRVVEDTTPENAVRAYGSNLTSLSGQSLADRTDRHGNGQLRITAFWIADSAGKLLQDVMLGESVRFCFAYKATNDLRNIHIGFTLQEQFGDPLINCTTWDTGQGFDAIPGDGVFTCAVERFPLRPGKYVGSAFVSSNEQLVDGIHGAFSLNVVHGDFFGTGKVPNGGKLMVAQAWKVCDVDGHPER